MRLLLRGVGIFLILLLATSVMVDTFKLEFGTVNYWQKHGVFFLIFITVFPRLTLIFSSVATGGILWWLALIFCPRILVASLATVAYFETNPILVTISWIIAFGGEVFEKWRVGHNRFVFRTYHHEGPQDFRQPHTTIIDKNGVIEAEFERKE